MEVTTAEQLAALRASFDAFTKSQEVANHDVAVHIKDLLQTLGKLAATQERHDRELAEVKPVTDMVTGLKARATGALMLLGVIGAIVWTGVQFFRQWIIDWLT
jgi:hypothetical protein